MTPTHPQLIGSKAEDSFSQGPELGAQRLSVVYRGKPCELRSYEGHRGVEGRTMTEDRLTPGPKKGAVALRPLALLTVS